MYGCVACIAVGENPLLHTCFLHAVISISAPHFVYRKTIVSQQVVAIKKTHQIMIESVAKELAYPSMTCPVTGQPFEVKDVLPLVRAVSGFAATGRVEAKKYRPGMN